MVWVKPGYSTPPSLENRSCLYVLRFSAGHGPRGPPRIRSSAWSPLEDHDFPPGGDERRRSVDTSPTDDTGRSSPGGADGSPGEDGEASARSGVPGAGTAPEKHAGKTRARGRRNPAGVVDEGPSASPDERGESGVWFYVGESDGVEGRLRQHRTRWGVASPTRSPSGSWSPGSGGWRLEGSEQGAGRLDAIVVPVDNKSEARRLEAALIRAMKGAGFHLLSDRDGSRGKPPSSAS